MTTDNQNTTSTTQTLAQDPSDPAPAACCSTTEQATCCEPSAKSDCCGTTADADAPSTCGCR